MRTFIAAVVLLTCLVATGSAQQKPEAPFKNAKAVQAWNRFQFQSAKAQEAYDRAMASARAEYMDGLKAAAELAAKAGDTEDLARIVEAQKGVDVKPDAPSLADQLDNTFWVRGSDAKWNWLFKSNGDVMSGPGQTARGQWQQVGDRTVIAKWGGFYVATFAADMKSARVYSEAGEWDLQLSSR